MIKILKEVYFLFWEDSQERRAELNLGKKISAFSFTEEMISMEGSKEGTGKC